MEAETKVKKFVQVGSKDIKLPIFIGNSNSDRMNDAWEQCGRHESIHQDLFQVTKVTVFPLVGFNGCRICITRDVYKDGKESFIELVLYGGD